LITQELIQRQNVTILVSSQPNQGKTFLVELPLYATISRIIRSAHCEASLGMERHFSLTPKGNLKENFRVPLVYC
jgi:hypothetical protein